MATAKKKATKPNKKASKKSESLLDKAVERLEEMADSEQAQDVKAAYQQIWHAGLGAYAKSADAISGAAKDSSEDGEKFFNSLVKDGAKLEKKAKKELNQLKDKVEDGIEEVSTKASDRVSKIEEAFDKRVAQAYNRLGLPSKSDIDTLQKKIDKLQRTIDADKKAAKPAATRTTRSRSKAAAKPAAAAE